VCSVRDNKFGIIYGNGGNPLANYTVCVYRSELRKKTTIILYVGGGSVVHIIIYIGISKITLLHRRRSYRNIGAGLLGYTVFVICVR